jgi:uncharacterized protein YjbI with pentapeptide repeats
MSEKRYAHSFARWLVGTAVVLAVVGCSSPQPSVLTEPVDVATINFGSADVRGANLEGAVLVKRQMMRVDLSKANLRGADLRQADLTRANLRGADLSGADLRWVNLTSANLREANLEGAIFFGDSSMGNFGYG